MGRGKQNPAQRRPTHPGGGPNWIWDSASHLHTVLLERPVSENVLTPPATQPHPPEAHPPPAPRSH